jgi:hypothetical protein
MSLTKQQVLDEVRHRLDDAHLPLHFEVLEGAVRKDDDWWYVPVTAKAGNGQPAPREIVVNAYANIENDIQVQMDTNVLFIPAEL